MRTGPVTQNFCAPNGQVFGPYLLCLDITVNVHDGSHDQGDEEDRFGRGGDRCREIEAHPADAPEETTIQLQQAGHANEDENTTHPEIADIREQGCGRFLSLAFQEANQDRAEDQEGETDNGRPFGRKG